MATRAFAHIAGRERLERSRRRFLPILPSPLDGIDATRNLAPQFNRSISRRL
jgi:hypothetical protein